MTDEAAAFARHRETVRRLSRRGGVLALDSPYATIRNPLWYLAGRPLAQRRQMQETRRIDLELKQPTPLLQSRAIVLAGPPGAGKTSTLRRLLGDGHAHWRPIDPDVYKRELLRQAVADETYWTEIRPPEVRDLEAGGEQFFPMELAALVHEESSAMAKDARKEALSSGVNVLIDTVLSSLRSADALAADLVAAQYTVDVIDVEVPESISRQRVDERWQRAYERALIGQSDLSPTANATVGGRWVPSDFSSTLWPAQSERATSQAAASRLAERLDLRSFRRFWNDELEIQTGEADL